MRALFALTLGGMCLQGCNCGGPREELVVQSGSTRVFVTVDRGFAVRVGDVQGCGGEALFVDVRPRGDDGGFAAPERNVEDQDPERFGAVEATVLNEDPLELELKLRRFGLDEDEASEKDYRRAFVTFAPAREGFVDIDVSFDVDEADIVDIGACFMPEFAARAVGGGERFDAVDLSGRIVPLYFAAPRPYESGTNEAHAPVPFVATTRGLGLYVESERVGAFGLNAFTHKSGLEARFHGATLPLRVRTGSIVDNVAAFARYAGLPKPPARFSLAPMQWRNALEPVVEGDVVVRSGSQLLLDDVEQMRTRGFPASTVWIDAPWETGYNTFVENTTQLPDLDDVFDTLRARGLHPIVWATEHLNTSDDHEQMIGMPEFGSRALSQQFEQQGYLVTTENGDPFEFPWGRGRGTFVDFTNEEACAAYRAQMAPLIARGVVGFKLDYGETMRPDLLGLENDVPRFSGGQSTRTMHTRYARLYHECFIDELRAQRGDDWFVITRTGGIGDQKNGTAIWPGDLDASFIPGGIESEDGLTVGGLPAAVAGMLSLSMSGYPLYGSDVGGYRGGAPSPELFLRWAQFGALSTVMQVGGGANFAPWDAGYEDVVDGIVAAARLHMQLWPSFEAWLIDASEDGTPVAVPVGVLAGEDEDAWADAYSYVLGDTLLVAPVVVEGARERELFVPEGRWVEITQDGDGAVVLGTEVLDGPGLRTVDAPLDRIVLFARDGAELVLGDPRLMSMLPTDAEQDGGFNFYGDTHTLPIEAP